MPGCRARLSAGSPHPPVHAVLLRRNRDSLPVAWKHVIIVRSHIWNSCYPLHGFALDGLCPYNPFKAVV